MTRTWPARSSTRAAGSGDDGVREKDGVQARHPTLDHQRPDLDPCSRRRSSRNSSRRHRHAGRGPAVRTDRLVRGGALPATRSPASSAVFFTTADCPLLLLPLPVQQPAPNRFRYSVPRGRWLAGRLHAPTRTRRSSPKTTLTSRNGADRGRAQAPLVHQLGTTSARWRTSRASRCNASRWLYRLQDIWMEE